MKRLLFFTLIIGMLAACSKDKFKTVPQVKITSFGPSEVHKGQLIQLLATVTDKEGDVQDSVLVVRKRYNNATLLSWDTVRNNIKNLGNPKKQEFELQVLFLYGELRPEVAPIQNLENADRGFSLGIIVVDKAGNRSEYVESDKILLKKL
ncbi:MAG: hypothetical protein M3Y85_04510 [Bacteroidota bacterium]|nr:hypothetical protein [Bacteroidota bacterium]